MRAHGSVVDVFVSLNDPVQTTIHSFRYVLCTRFVLNSARC